MIGFLGCGNLAQALILGIIEKNIISPTQILITTRTPKKSHEFGVQTGVVVARNNHDLISRSEMIFVGIKPFEIFPALEELSQHDLKNKIVISLAAGVGEEILKKYLSQAQGVFRVMANLSATIQSGLFGVYGIKSNPESRKKVEDFFSCLGEIISLKSDKEVNVITAGSASGLGFVFSFMEEFQCWFEKKGLSKEAARRVTVETFLGASRLAKIKIDQDLSQLKEAVTSKKGTTLAGLKVFKKLRLQTSLRSGLEAAFKRSQQIAKDLLPHTK